MSLTLSNVAQTEFDALVHAEFRSRGFLLRDTVYTKSDVVGATCQFRKMSQVVANQVGYQTTIAIQDPNFTAHTATLLKYAAGVACDEIQDLTVNFSAKEELAMCVAHAVGRRADQIIINAIEAGVGTPVPVGGTNMSYAKLRHVVQLFEDNAVPLDERYIAMSGNNLRALLASDQIISRFYTSNEATSTGTLNKRDILGMNVRIIPSMVEGGLSITGTERVCLAWAKRAVGMAIGQDLRTEVNYLPRDVSWFVNGLFFAGAIAIDSRGIFTITCDESVNP